MLGLFVLLILSLGLFHIDKIISTLETSISCSKDRWRSYICIPSGAQTHIIACTLKGSREQGGATPFCAEKPFKKKTIKNSSISH